MRAISCTASLTKIAPGVRNVKVAFILAYQDQVPFKPLYHTSRRTHSGVPTEYPGRVTVELPMYDYEATNTMRVLIVCSHLSTPMAYIRFALLDHSASTITSRLGVGNKQ